MSDDRWSQAQGEPLERLKKSTAGNVTTKAAYKPHKPDRPRKADPAIVQTELARIRRLLSV